MNGGKLPDGGILYDGTEDDDDDEEEEEEDEDDDSLGFEADPSQWIPEQTVSQDPSAMESVPQSETEDLRQQLQELQQSYTMLYQEFQSLHESKLQ